ncbi:MAG: RNB domain-containing ribonuclease, partial [Oscillospiraceae bacterium]|nr:RNB domain-containing ribonuclease [Oscillospiraceae bacterium]
MNKQKTAILSLLYKAGDRGLSEKEIAKELDLPRKSEKKLADDLAGMKKFGDISNKKGIWRLKNPELFFEATITRVTPRSGFMTDESGELPVEYFVRGRDMKGSIPGDIVLAKKTAEAADGKSPEAVVFAVLQESDRLLTGVIVAEGNRLMVMPDKLCDEPLFIAKAGSKPLHVGDKVAFSIKKRGERHFDHTVAIADAFGSSENAKSSAEAYMLVNGLHTEFPDEVLAEAAKLDIDEPDADEINRRLDLRGEPIFTIDGADTKDIDDAVSISKVDGGYKLGVH